MLHDGTNILWRRQWSPKTRKAAHLARAKYPSMLKRASERAPQWRVNDLTYYRADRWSGVDRQGRPMLTAAKLAAAASLAGAVRSTACVARRRTAGSGQGFACILRSEARDRSKAMPFVAQTDLPALRWKPSAERPAFYPPPTNVVRRLLTQVLAPKAISQVAGRLGKPGGRRAQDGDAGCRLALLSFFTLTNALSVRPMRRAAHAPVSPSLVRKAKVRATVATLAGSPLDLHDTEEGCVDVELEPRVRQGELARQRADHVAGP